MIISRFHRSWPNSMPTSLSDIVDALVEVLCRILKYNRASSIPAFTFIIFLQVCPFSPLEDLRSEEKVQRNMSCGVFFQPSISKQKRCGGSDYQQSLECPCQRTYLEIRISHYDFLNQGFPVSKSILIRKISIVF